MSKKITKSAALDRFINERVLGDRGFAINSWGICLYDHYRNGGCEIGQYLPEDVAATQAGDYYNLPRYITKKVFEEPSSDFWPDLQLAHDNLARASWFRASKRPWLHSWELFESALFRICSRHF